VKDNIWYFDDTVIVYPAGDNIVVFDTVRKTQKFMNSTLTPGSGVTETVGNSLPYNADS
jgi:preprotein translocase subunit SecF